MANKKKKSTGIKKKFMKRWKKTGIYKYYKKNKKTFNSIVIVLLILIAVFLIGRTVRQITEKTNYGIDVSQYQENINWSEVREDGLSYVFIRCGGRSYGENGVLIYDPMFKKNFREARARGFDTGVYFYSQAINKKEAIEEAEFCLTVLDGRSLQLPVYIDVEYSGAGNGRADNLSRAERTEVVEAFCKVISDAGYKPGVYSNRYFLEENLELTSPALKDVSVWLAEYHNGSKPGYKGDYDFWQYTSEGEVSGIKGNVDLNRCNPEKPRVKETPIKGKNIKVEKKQENKKVK